jgi:hypothetical protein
MRDFLAGLIALALLVAAASLATTLQYYRRRRQRAREQERTQGRTVIAELPTGDDLVLFSEDDQAFHYGPASIPKRSIMVVRVLINGSPIAAVSSKGHPGAASAQPTRFEDRPEGIARDRWDVALETTAGTTLVACGAIRERVSQELARAVFDAVVREIERQNSEVR